MKFSAKSKSKDDKQKPSTSESNKKSILEAHGFTMSKLIGSGTYAKVVLAYSEYLKCSVAIKIISKMKAPKEYLTKFLPREIEVVKRLQHENIIHFYQSIETTHRVYLIMQYAENGSMLDLIRKYRNIHEDIARKYFRQLISAIDYCHNQGIVHRDIKCENLLLDKNFDLKIIDFGFARKNMRPINNRPIMSETYCGSYAYASPEILKGIPYDPRYSDAWASGVVLFAMVFGRLPFEAMSFSHLLKQVQKEVDFPKDPKVSQSCKSCIQKILAPIKIRLGIKLIKEEPWYKEPIKYTILEMIAKQTTTIKKSSDKGKLIDANGGTFIKPITKKESLPPILTQKSSIPPVLPVTSPSPTVALPVSDKIVKESTSNKENIDENQQKQIQSSTKLESLSIKVGENNTKEKIELPLIKTQSEHINIAGGRNSIAKDDSTLELKTTPQIVINPPLIGTTVQIVSETTKNGEDTGDNELTKEEEIVEVQ